jgi:glutamate racemase
MKIGFFDSGLGGLTILKAVAKELSEYDYVFYGDTANLPYGDKSEEEINRLTKAGVEYLFDKDCRLIIIACNTASAETLRKLQTELLVGKHKEKRILGVIIPTVEAIVESNQQNVSLIATKRTVESKKYDAELVKRVGERTKLISTAVPGLVPLIELGDVHSATNLAINTLKDDHTKPDLIVLACTHYTEIKLKLRDFFGDSAIILSQDEIIPPSLKKYLVAHPEIESLLSKDKQRQIFLTEHSQKYDRIIQQFLGSN